MSASSGGSMAGSPAREERAPRAVLRPAVVRRTTVKKWLRTPIRRAIISDNTRRVYGAQWRLFESWCGEMGLRSLPAAPLTVARYLAARANAGASIATLRLATSAVTKAHDWAGHDSPGKDRGVRESLKGWGRRLGKPQRQAGALTADVLAVISPSARPAPSPPTSSP